MSRLLDLFIVFRIFATNFAWLTQYQFLQELQLQRKLCWMLSLFHTQSALFRAGSTLRLGISDHDLIYIVRKQGLPKPNVTSIEYRSMKNWWASFSFVLKWYPMGRCLRLRWCEWYLVPLEKPSQASYWSLCSTKLQTRQPQKQSPAVDQRCYSKTNARQESFV